MLGSINREPLEGKTSMKTDRNAHSRRRRKLSEAKFGARARRFQMAGLNTGEAAFAASMELPNRRPKKKK